MAGKAQASEAESWLPSLIPYPTRNCGPLSKSFDLSEPVYSSVTWENNDCFQSC